MDAKQYLKSFGWQEGEALLDGGLRKPILVQHKKDTKGLGHNNQDGETWWESLFDGHLKNLEVNKSGNGVQFSIDEEKVDRSIRKKNSPLYRMFVRGEGLAGTVGKTNFTVKSKKMNAEEVYEKQVHSKLLKEAEETVAREEGRKRGREESESKKNKKQKKEKKEKRDKKEEKEKIEKKDKKDKKDKKEKKEKKDKIKKDKQKDKKVKKEKKDKKNKSTSA